MKKPISSGASSTPSRFFWMMSTARTDESLLLLEALDLGPEVPLLAGGGHVRRRRGRGSGRLGHAREDLLDQRLLVVLLALALGRDLSVPVVVGVVAGAARDLGHGSLVEAGHVVVQQEAAPRAIVVDHIA